MWKRSCFAVLCLLIGVSGCKREDEGSPQPGYAPAGQYVPPLQGPPSTAGNAVPGAPAPAAAAFGIPCQSDADLQCPFGRCIGGRCGGCGQPTDCKSGSTCAWTPIGMACVIGGGAVPIPTYGAPGGPAPPVGPAPTVPSGSNDGYQAARKLCVDRTNEFRARVGAAPLTRSPGQEGCNDQQARSDGSTNAIHGAFGRCNESAQNECPNWPGPPDGVIGPCLQQMFDEGPGPYADHGHYINMTNRQYTSVSCGVYVMPSGRVWVIQDFY